jgi:23S rRNA (guanosine2251-2'-O)-methyltransferase
MGMVYGIHAVEEALKADAGRIERICVQRGQNNHRVQQIIDLGREKHVPISFEDKSWLDRKAEGERHQGVLCYVAEMPTLAVEDLIEQAAAPGLMLILDGIEDPHNLGAILRSAEVAKADGIILPQRRAAGLGPAVVKSSAGAANYIKIARAGNIVNVMNRLKTSGFWLVGLAGEAGNPIWEVDFKMPTALILGNEGNGLHRLVKENCDFLVSIPVRGRIASHNVSVAAGIALYEVLRQRSKL